MRRYDHILFDLDGTLADTPDFHCKVFIDYFTECGKVFDPDKITNGLQKTLSIRDVLRDAGVKDEEEEEDWHYHSTAPCKPSPACSAWSGPSPQASRPGPISRLPWRRSA